jgi:error-prone DNA polymerase
MGFYAPAQLVRDAREHGVEVRPVDVFRERAGTPRWKGRAPVGLRPVRLGLSRISGLPEETPRSASSPRVAAGPFASTEDLARRAALDARALQLLARPMRCSGLAGHRHQAAWAVAGVDTRATPMLRATRTHEPRPRSPRPEVAEDRWPTTARSASRCSAPGGAAARAARRLQGAAGRGAGGYPHGRLARASGLVTHRQRPETAKGVVFVTLEDETGAVNVIVWPRVVERSAAPLLAARLLTVYGQSGSARAR